MKSEQYILKAKLVLKNCSLEFQKVRDFQVKTLQGLRLTYSGEIDTSIDLLKDLDSKDLKSAYANLVLVSNLFLKGKIKEAKSLIGKYYFQ